MPRKRQPAQPSPQAPDVTRAASIVGVFGSSGSGKSAYIKARLRDELGAAFVFDPGHEYARGIVAGDEARAYAVMNAGQDVTLRPSHDGALRARQFSRFCRAALAWARARGRCLVVVDELHLLTEPGRSPESWHELVVTGRKFGVAILAASIRPAAVDKDFWTCCTLVRAGRMLYEDDRRTVARALDCDPAELRDLKAPPAAPGCDWIERDMLTGQTRRGRLTF